MADQNRWTEDRDRGGRYGEDERSRWSGEDQGRGGYRGAERERGGYGAERYGQSQGEGRSFGDNDYESGGGYGQGYGAGYGMGGLRYGEGGYGGSRSGESGRDERYGGRWGAGPSGSEDQSGQYGQSQHGQGQYGQGQYGQGGSDRGPYGQGGYGESRHGAGRQGSRYEENRYGSQGGERYGGGRYGSRGYGVQDYGEGRGFERGDHDRTWMERAGEKIGQWFTGDREAGHRGRGPKNYTRSDDRIREDVNDRLTDDPWLDASEIEVQVSSCEVTLTGTVDSREDKRRAEDLAEQVSGVRHVQNNLRVSQQAATSMGGGAATGTSGGTATGSTTGATATGGSTGAGRTGSTRSTT